MNIIKTVSRSFDWASPERIDTMYCDDEDYFGLRYWYKDVKEQHDEIEANNKKK